MTKMIIYKFEMMNGVWHWNYLIRPFDRILNTSLQQVRHTTMSWLDVARWDENEQHWDTETEAARQAATLDRIYNPCDKALEVLKTVKNDDDDFPELPFTVTHY